MSPFTPRTYSLCGPVEGLCESWGVWGTDGSCTSPLFYLRRPKWIKDDAAWERIVQAVRLELPEGTEIQ